MSNVASVTTATTNTIVASANTAVRTLRPDLIALREAVVGDGRCQAKDISGPGY